jgi:uncharacterized protein YdeI (YjbR/CyaY-like superfamily)
LAAADDEVFAVELEKTIENLEPYSRHKRNSVMCHTWQTAAALAFRREEARKADSL